MTTVEIFTAGNRVTREMEPQVAYRLIGQRVAIGWTAVGWNFLDPQGERVWIVAQSDEFTGKLWALYINV